MKLLIYGVVLLTILSAVIANWHVPKIGLNLWTLRKVSDAEFAVMREDAVRRRRGAGRASPGGEVLRDQLPRHARDAGEQLDGAA